MENKISEENKNIFRKFRRWIVIQKVTLARGYGDISTVFLGVIAASSLKAAFPGAINSIWKFIALAILGLVGLYVIGWIDIKLKIFHEENNVVNSLNPYMMEVVDASRKKNSLE